MKLLWLCNMAPGPVQQMVKKSKKGGLWMDHVLADLRLRENLEIRILCPGPGENSGSLDGRCSWHTFPKAGQLAVEQSLQDLFSRDLKAYQPDVVHIWGTEYGHTLCMMRACRELGLLDRTVISIQGLCSIYARHYLEGIPYETLKKATLRDLLRHDRMTQQQQVFCRRGQNEEQALQLARHVIGRTHWDRACARKLAPEAEYHFCNETLREDFYGDVWQYAACEKHRIFASNCVYPIKGFHYLLEAFAQLSPKYPDAVLAVPGKNPIPGDFKTRLRQDGYARYLETLIRKNHLEGRVQFLGSLSGEEMKQQYLKANVFVLPSTIENSPNSLGEAMLLGVPCAAADVGGVTTMLEPDREGIVYQSTAPYMLADAIEKIFAMEDRAETMGKAAALHARKTHDPEKNLRDLLAIYEKIASGEESR